ncbi:MAG: hypothetical protein H0X24_15890 [Ktedonobacterales bacterium]|nr:hypothetical protein [Ktedonobacterales bacterium]
MSNKKPSRYYIGYEDANLYAKELARVHGEADNIDPTEIYANIEAGETLPAAIRVARKISKQHDTTAFIYERPNIHQEPLSDEFYWVIKWVWDDEHEDVVADVSNGEVTRYTQTAHA